MKTFNTLLTTLITVFMLNSVSFQAQTYAETPESTDESYRSNTAIQSFIASQNSGNNQTATRSSVFVDQVGNNNESFVRYQANNATINLVQRGFSNSTLIDVVANEITYSIIQNGNQNRVFNLSNNPALNQNMDIIQNGVNHDLTIYGSNSLSENIKINMQGSDRSIIVRNFD